MASVLFLAPADLGETVLATGALAHVLGEGDQLTVFCETPAQALFRAMPQLVGLSSPAPGSNWRAAAGLVLAHLGRPFDILFDARGGAGSYFIAARRRITRQAPTVLRHMIEELSDLVGAERTLAPKLAIDEQARANAAAFAPGSVLVLAPGGAIAGKRWAPERFAAVARRLQGGPLAQTTVVAVGAGARDRTLTRTIVSSLDADGVPARDLGAEFDLLDCAALMERATLCIGNDNALTHIAAAMGAPTLSLFGPTDERVRAPYGPRARTLRGKSFEEIAALAPLDEGAAMEDVSIDAVEAAALDLLHAGGLR